MKCQVCEIVNGKLRHVYKGVRGMRFSMQRATIFSVEEARKLLKECGHHNLFIVIEGDVHYRETDTDGYILEQQKLA